MNQRERQRAETRDRILEAAIAAFAERGFEAASTRDIATRAGVNQGLLTYHFKSKDALWRAAADRLFETFRASIAEHLPLLAGLDPRAQARDAIRHFVRFSAEHPEQFRFMLEAGKSDDERMQWLVDTHLRPMWDLLPEEHLPEEPLAAHFRYVIVGAGSMFFAVAPEVRRLTGIDPMKPEAIERHAQVVADLLVPPEGDGAPLGLAASSRGRSRSRRR